MSRSNSQALNPQIEFHLRISYLAYVPHINCITLPTAAATVQMAAAAAALQKGGRGLVSPVHQSRFVVNRSTTPFRFLVVEKLRINVLAGMVVVWDGC